MRIFVTGATGYIGNQLVKQLAAQEEEIHLLVRDPRSPHLPAGRNIRVFKGDITDPGSIAPAIKGCAQVYHCAAIAKFSGTVTNAFMEVNVNGTKNVLAAALDASVQKLVFTSSAAVWGPTLQAPFTEEDERIGPFESEYDRSKYLAETLVKEFAGRGLNAVIVNPTRVYGPGPATYSNAVNRMINYILNKKIVLFPNMDQYITNYTYIEDIVNGHLLAMEKGKAGERYILGGENISYGQLLQSVRDHRAVKNLILKLPVPLLKTVAALAYFLNKKTELTPSLVSRFAKHRILSSEKAIVQLGYRITPFEAGLQTTIDSLKSKAYKKRNSPPKFYQYGKDQVSTGTP
ncbi:MAG: NAD-dependent epimerase/dehydratase family protein [Chitinophagaceae bacterium]